MRLLPVLVVILGGCGSGPCGDYLDAVIACYADAGVDAPLGVDVQTQCPEATSRAARLYYRCRRDAWAAGSCATAEGLRAIQQQEAACTLGDPG